MLLNLLYVDKGLKVTVYNIRKGISLNRGKSFFDIKDDCMKNLYKTKKIRRGWIVVNKETGNHSHFRSSYGCRCILIFIEKEIIPDNTYLKESYRRLTAAKEPYKQKYNNKPMMR